MEQFIKQKDPSQILELETVISNIRNFVMPIVNNKIKHKSWDHVCEKWI